MKKFAAATLFLLVMTGAQSQPQVRSVAVSAASEDPVGQRFVYQIKEGIRKSSSMRYQESSTNAVIVLHVVTLRNDDGLSTAYSVTWTMGSEMWFYDSTVGICGGNKVASCAEGIVARTDALRERLVKK